MGNLHLPVFHWANMVVHDSHSIAAQTREKNKQFIQVDQPIRLPYMRIAANVCC